MPHDYSGMSRDELEDLHGQHREVMAAARAEMDAIEAVLLPLHMRDSAWKKLARAGLSPAEINALGESHRESLAADSADVPGEDAGPAGPGDGDLDVRPADDQPPPRRPPGKRR